MKFFKFLIFFSIFYCQKLVLLAEELPISTKCGDLAESVIKIYGKSDKKYSVPEYKLSTWIYEKEGLWFDITESKNPVKQIVVSITFCAPFNKKVSEIKIGDTSNDVLNIFGLPDTTIRSEDQFFTFQWYYNARGINILISDQKVQRITIKNINLWNEKVKTRGGCLLGCW